jgi:hypothetical protein
MSAPDVPVDGEHELVWLTHEHEPWRPRIV